MLCYRSGEKQKISNVGHVDNESKLLKRKSQKKKKKIKVTLVQALRLCTGRTAHRGSRGMALPFHDHGTRRDEGSASRPGRFLPPGKNQYPLYGRLGWPQGRSGQVRKISPTTGIRSPDRPARSQSLYGLSYRAHKKKVVVPTKSLEDVTIKCLRYGQSRDKI